MIGPAPLPPIDPGQLPPADLMGNLLERIRNGGTLGKVYTTQPVGRPIPITDAAPTAAGDPVMAAILQQLEYTKPGQSGTAGGSSGVVKVAAAPASSGGGSAGGPLLLLLLLGGGLAVWFVLKMHKPKGGGAHHVSAD